MRRILPDTRREIIRLKLQGATNQEAAETLGVSKGTVSNVVSEARDGEFPPFDDLDEQLDSLID